MIGRPWPLSIVWVHHQKENRRAVDYSGVGCQENRLMISSPVPIPVRNDECNARRQSATLQYHGRINSVDGAGGACFLMDATVLRKDGVLPRVKDFWGQRAPSAVWIKRYNRDIS